MGGKLSFNVKAINEKIGQCDKAMYDFAKQLAESGEAATGEQLTAYDRMDAEAKALRQTKELIEKQSATAKAEYAADNAYQGNRKRDTELALRAWALHGTEDQKAEYIDAANRLAFNYQSATYADDDPNTTANLPDFIPSTLNGSIEVAMKDYSAVLQAADVFTTSGGGEWKFPYVNETVIKGAKLGEAQEDDIRKVDESYQTCPVFKYTSRMVHASDEALSDSQYPLESFIVGLLAERLGRIANEVLTTGDGSGDPQGAATGANSVGTTNGAALQDSELAQSTLLTMIHSIDSAYRRVGRCEFQFSDETLRDLRLIVDDVGRPIWQPSLTSNEPSQVYGFPYRVNPDLASSSTASNGDALILFGDWSRFKVRRAGLGGSTSPIITKVLRERYAEFGLVSFVALTRLGSVLIEPGVTTMAKIVYNAS